MSPLSVPFLSLYTRKMSPKSLVTTYGNEFVLKPPPRPRSPCAPVPVRVAAVVMGPKETPWFVDFTNRMTAGFRLIHQNTYTAWSDPTATNGPSPPPLSIRPGPVPNVAPPSVDRLKNTPFGWVPTV